MERIEITCDACGTDLTFTTNCEDWRLVLANQSLPSRGGLVTLAAIYPAIKRTAHFCGIQCLRQWLDKEYPADKKHHGGKMGNWKRDQAEPTAEPSGTVAS